MILFRFAETVVKEIDERIEAKDRAMRKGLEQAEYMRTVGSIQALESIRQFIDELATNAESDDDN